MTTLQNEFPELVRSAWGEVGRPAFERIWLGCDDQDLERAILTSTQWGWYSMIERFEKYYPLSTVSIEFAAYFLGCYLIYGYRTWFIDDIIYDQVAIDFFLFCSQDRTRSCHLKKHIPIDCIELLDMFSAAVAHDSARFQVNNELKQALLRRAIEY